MLLKDNGKNGTLKHRLVAYVMNYDKVYFLAYVFGVASELVSRGINFNVKYYDEIVKFCHSETDKSADEIIYPEHNDRYLKQCYYNLQEKYDRGIISEEEFNEILNATTINLNSSVSQIKELL